MSKVKSRGQLSQNAHLDKKFERLLKQHGGQPRALIPLLQEVQALYSYLPKAVLYRIACACGRTPAEVYGVVSFYKQFRLRPTGKLMIRVCHGTACHVAGADRIEEAVSDALGIKAGGTTADGRYSLERVACLGCCSLAPVIMIGDRTYGRLTPRKVERLFPRYPKKSRKSGKPARL